MGKNSVKLEWCGVYRLPGVAHFPCAHMIWAHSNKLQEADDT